MNTTSIAGTYTIDPTHTEIGFVARHAMVTKVRGSFTEFEGTASTGDDLAGAAIDLTIQVASVNTGSADRDAHLRSADFFDVETYPTMRFVSHEITFSSPEVLHVVGDLTIKDVTRPVTIDFDYEGSAKDPFGNVRVGFSGSTVVNRKDFGLTWNAALETGGVLVSENVTLEFEVSAIKATEPIEEVAAPEADEAPAAGSRPAGGAEEASARGLKAWVKNFFQPAGR